MARTLALGVTRDDDALAAEAEAEAEAEADPPPQHRPAVGMARCEG